MTTDTDLAKILLEEIETQIRLGTRHYSKGGHPLQTVAEIREALRRDGAIQISARPEGVR